ncbi:MAG: ParA family protein [Rikenellaceae bacterium]
MNTRIITVSNNKGGVAKTTTCVTLLHALAKRGHRVLGIDLDPQRNLSIALGAKRKETIVNAFNDHINMVEETMLPIENIRENLDIVSASPMLEGMEQMLVAQPSRENILKIFIQRTLKVEQYDFIIIDTRPSLGVLTTNAIVASTDIIVPIETDFLAIQGVLDLIKKLKRIIQLTNPDLNILGFIATKYNKGVNMNDNALKYLYDTYGDVMFKSVIHKNIALSESISKCVSIFDYKPDSRGAADYDSLTDEILTRVNE